MSAYDNYLLRGSDDFPNFPQTPSESLAVLRAHPREFEIEGDVDSRGLPWASPSNAPGRNVSPPNNARAKRIRARIFHQLTRRERKERERARRVHRLTGCWPDCGCARCWPDVGVGSDYEVEF